jgi:L-galactose dehydrogenase
METNILGRTGLRVTAAGLGCGGHSQLGMFTKGMDNAVAIVRRAIELGVNFIDTAHVYGTQPAVGKALEGVRRDSYILSSKFPYNSRTGLQDAGALETTLDQALRELKTDYVDIYHLHGVTPQDYAGARDRFYPELLKMKEKGKIRFVGITEMFGADTSHQALTLALADDLWDVMMVGYNILNPSAARTILPEAMQKNVGILNMFAVRKALSDPAQLREDVCKILAAGQADSKLVKPENTLDFLVAEGYAKTITEAAYRFCRHTKGIDVTLTGTGDLNHLAVNINSLTAPPLPDQVLERLDAMFGRVDCVSGQKSFP